jgi:hypothetical protein
MRVRIPRAVRDMATRGTIQCCTVKSVLSTTDVVVARVVTFVVGAGAATTT